MALLPLIERQPRAVAWFPTIGERARRIGARKAALARYPDRYGPLAP